MAEKSDVASAEFSGYDGSEDPYTINANSATQDANEPSKTFMQVVRGRLKTNKSGEILHMKSDTGIYNSDNKMLDLDGNVELVSTDNYVAYLADAQVNVDTKRLRSDKPVHVIFDQGTINAHAVEMWNNGNTILFKNGVKMRIDQRPVSGKDNSK